MDSLERENRIAVKPRGREVAAIVLSFVALTALYLRIAPARFTGSIAPDQGDPLFNLAILRWVASRVPVFFEDFWSPTFFFPHRGVLALSDHLAGPGVVAALLAALGWTPAAVYNTLLLAAFAGGAISCHLVFRRSGLSPAAAAFGAVVWSFSPHRWEELSHLQVLLVPWIPWTLWTFARLLEEPSRRRALNFLMFYLLHISGGAYLAYLIHLPLLTLVIVRLRHDRERLLVRRSLGVVGLTALVCVGAFVLLYAPYARLRSTLGVETTETMIQPFEIGLRNLVSVGPRTSFASLVPTSLLVGQGGLFLGLCATPIALWGMVRRWRRERSSAVGPPSSNCELWWRALGWIAALCLLASWWPIARMLRMVLPGFESIRVPGRLFVFASFAFAAYAGLGFDEIQRRINVAAARYSAAALLLAALALESAPRARFIPWYELPSATEMPPVYRWLAAHDEVGALVELPLRPNWKEAKRLYFWSLHRRPLVNGYSGYLPANYETRRAWLLDFPDAARGERLRRLGVTHLVVHLDLLKRPDRQHWRRWHERAVLAGSPWIERVAELESAVVYKLLDEAAR